MSDSQASAGESPARPARSAPAATVEESPSRIHLVVGGLIALAVIAAALIGVLAGNSPSPLTPGKPVPGASEASSLFAGVPEHGLSLGSPQAPVTLGEIADLQCPPCAGFAEKSLPTLISRYVDTGMLRIVFEPLDVVSSESLRAARVAVAAGQQSKLWPFVYLMYRNQAAQNTGYVTSAYLRALADSVHGLDVNEAFEAKGSAAVNATIARSVAEAQRHGVYSSPSFVLSRTGGRPRRFDPTSAIDPSAFAGPIERLLPRG